MSNEGLVGMLMAAQGMGGFRAGTATMSLFSQFAGGRMTAQVAKELHGLGLVGNYETIRGGGVQFDKGALNTPFIKQLLIDPLAGMGTLRDTLGKHGIEGDAMNTEIFKIFGRQTTQRLASDFLTNLETMIAERTRTMHGQDLDEQYKTRQEQDYDTNIRNVDIAWQNFMSVIGAPLTIKAIGYLQQITIAIDSWTAKVEKMNPGTIVRIAEAIGVLGLTLIGAGAVAIIAALGPAGWIVLGIGSLAAALAAFKPEAFNSFIHGIETLIG
ncbi:MAG: hypothetical protein WDN02_05160 [Methylovirgula sp.]|uniref:hypothetical protein n=1 Tax=Methylovirgula sp. TaxID=1978224 RepID=UPI00307637AE